MKPCIRCEGTNFGEGETRGEGNIHRIDKLLSMGSPLLFTICLDCGEINSIRVKHPENFKTK